MNNVPFWGGMGAKLSNDAIIDLAHYFQQGECMPGTHYDNDHSFIEVLPFQYKRVAFRILRQASFQTLLKDLNAGYSIHFDNFPDPESLNIKLVERALSACIVAKVTSFAKDCYVNPVQFRFVEEVLFKALNNLMDIAGLPRKAVVEILSREAPKTYHWLTKHRGDNGKYSLAIRSRRENTRRYFRYRAKIKYHFIRIGSHERSKEVQGNIFSTGIQHFSKIVNRKLDSLVVSYSHSIKLALQEKFPEAHDLFMEVLDKLEYLREVINGVSVGKLDITNAKRFLSDNIKHHLDYASLNQNARTESILRDFEEKLNQINHHTLELIEKSTPHNLYEGPVLMKLKIDHDIRGYVEKNKTHPSKLLSAFVDLYHYTLLLEKIYNSISSSNYIIIFPEYWVDTYHDLSPGGFAFYSEFLVSVNDILEVFLQINVSDDYNVEEFEIIQQRVKVVRIEEKEDKGYYLIACHFLMISDETRLKINHALQAQEIIDAFNSSDLLDEDSLI